MSTLNLTKGSRIELTKGSPGLSVVTFALGWDERIKATPTEADFDPDACAIVLHHSRPWQNPSDLLFYRSNVENYDASGNPIWVDKTKPYPFILDGAIRSSGDERKGGTSGTDQETITIDLSKLSTDVSHIALLVTIYDVETRKQNFGMMHNAYCRIEAPGYPSFPVYKADLTEDMSAYTGFVFGYLYRKDGEWKYNSAMLGVGPDSKTADGKTLAEYAKTSQIFNEDGKTVGAVNVATIAPNLTAILGIVPETTTA